MTGKQNSLAEVTELRRRAETRLRKQQSKSGSKKPVGDAQRLLHELQVHQIELEMQNAELQEARDKTEEMLEKYADLYDFAPVGYFSLDEKSLILEANLTGAALFGTERARLINRHLSRFLVPASQPVFLAFLEEVFARPGKQVCEATVQKEDGTTFWADFHATSAVSLSSSRKWCRVAVSDITALKRVDEAQRRMEALAVTNYELQQEVFQRRAAEESLRKSEQHQIRLLEQAHHMQERLRHLSHQMLRVLEEERKKISRELHDQIAQTLTGINFHLSALKTDAAGCSKELTKKIASTQRLVEKSVDLVHRFALELRPPVLDDLGLIPALHSFMKDFSKREGIHTHLNAFAGIEKLSIDRRTVLYRVAQEAIINIGRHAQASQVTVSIRKLSDTVRMEIKDNGKGFEMEQVLFAKKDKRLGMLGMRERVEMVGGSFAVESVPDEGTTIRVQIPLKNGAK